MIGVTAEKGLVVVYSGGEQREAISGWAARTLASELVEAANKVDPVRPIGMPLTPRTSETVIHYRVTDWADRELIDEMRRPSAFSPSDKMQVLFEAVARLLEVRTATLADFSRENKRRMEET